MREDDRGRKFAASVQKMRKRQGYTLEQVCEGICSPAAIHYMELGKYRPDKLVRDGILDRLGAGVDDCELYLDLEEYGRFAARDGILRCIAYEEADQAEGLLEKYRKAYDMENPLERQFSLCMEVQIRRWRGGGREELSALLEEAAALTIPGLHHKPLDELVLSARELNLILEAESARPEGERPEQYRQAVTYIEKKQMDGIARAKIYPKAVYFLCRSLLGKKVGEVPLQSLEEALRYCERAIELLRDAARLHYLRELLEMQERLAGLLAQRYLREGRQEKTGELAKGVQERAGWTQALEAVFTEQGLCRESMDLCYFYQETGCFCINDVIRDRREMLGMSRRELCEGICSEKTLKRLERKETQPQLAITEKLLERLGLPGEYVRTDLITDRPEARELMRRLRRCANHGKYDQALELLDQIKAMVPMDIRFNRQVTGRLELLCRWEKEEIDRETYYKKMRAILELTLPYDAFFKAGKKYLTYEEQICILNMRKVMDKENGEYALCVQRFEEMYQSLEEKGMLEMMAGMYELAMLNIGSDLGDRGEYDKSDRYSDGVLRECLAYRRLESIKSCLYNRWWNHDKRRSEGIQEHRELGDREELEKCIAFADMDKDTGRMEFYGEKLARFN